MARIKRLDARRILSAECESLIFERVGERLAVEYMNERFPVTVETNDATPLFDPENTRVRS